MPYRTALRLPLIQGFALRTGLIVTDPQVDADMNQGYIAQHIRAAVERKMKRLESEL